MTKHALGAAFAGATLLATAVAVSAPASAAGGVHRGELAPGCVSQSEYNSLRIGMTRARVHEITGTVGQASAGGPRFQARIYDKCGPSDAWVSLSFRQRDDGSWRLTEKASD